MEEFLDNAGKDKINRFHFVSLLQQPVAGAKMVSDRLPVQALFFIKRSPNVLWSAKPRTIARIPEVATSPLSGSPKTKLITASAEQT